MARAVYSCTKCRPVDTSIIEAYMVLVKTTESASRAESGRASAEASRAEAETERARVSAADHATAVADHATAASDHASTASAVASANAAASLANQKAELVQGRLDIADADHARAESDHGIAADDHATAAVDHGLATSDHDTASSDHSASVEATGRANHAADVALDAAGQVGKYYGVFTSESLLPTDDDTPGYALVGETSPLKVYNYDGSVWSDSGAEMESLQGKSAYEVAVDEGYTGTEEEWLASLNGVGFMSVDSSQDGTIIITLTNGDTITVDLNHSHPLYEENTNKVNSLSSSSTTSQYPSAKCVYDEVHPSVQSSQPAGGFLPNVEYNLGTVTGSVTFSLAAGTAGMTNHYFWSFDTGSTAPTITWPSGVSWSGGSTPEISANSHYEVSILNGVGVYMEV